MEFDAVKYIESGMLERYASGQLDGEEFNEVQRLLSIHLELGEELEHIYSKLEG